MTHRHWSSRVMMSSRREFRATPEHIRCVTSPSGTAPLRRCRQTSWSAGRPKRDEDQQDPDDRNCGSSVRETSAYDRGPSGTMETWCLPFESPRCWPLPPTSTKENPQRHDVGTARRYHSTPVLMTRTSQTERSSRRSVVSRAVNNGTFTS